MSNNADNNDFLALFGSDPMTHQAQAATSALQPNTSQTPVSQDAVDPFRQQGTSTSKVKNDEERDSNQENLAGINPKYSLPGFGLPLNYFPNGFRFPNATDMVETKVATAAFSPLMLRELTMLQIMNAITDKPDWDKKVFNDEIVARWKEEGRASGQDITPAMLDWCFNELRYRAGIYQKTGCVSVFNGDVVKSDVAVPSEIKEALRQAIRPLEDVPDKDKDWHPGSDGKVLDLVHPSLFPLLYGRSRVLENERTNLKDFVRRCGEGKVVPKPKKEEMEQEDCYVHAWPRAFPSYSGRFQWLPAEVKVTKDEEGKIRSKFTSYINNLHPAKYPKLYELIEEIISCSIPLWGRSLTPLKHPWEDIQTPRIGCSGIEYRSGGDDSNDNDHDENEEQDEEDDVDRGPLVIPDAPEWEDPRPHPEDKIVDLVKENSDKGLQVIVKLANIHLTPEKPEYGGGTWHVEGQLNEHICATSLYYYDSENTTPTHLAFRQQSDQGYFQCIDYEQDDHGWLQTLYGLGNEDAAVQQVGSVETRDGRLLTFPNVLQHQVQPFKLADPTKPGHRKILALFLVDPNVRIVSTANVPCQRRDWWAEAVRQYIIGAEGTGDDGQKTLLPVELRDLILDNVDGFPVGLEEAKELRLELMEERKKFVLGSGGMFTTATISLCEH